MDLADELKRLLKQISEAAYEASCFAGQLEFPDVLQSDSIQNRNICMPKVLPPSLTARSIECAIGTRSSNAPTVAKLKQNHRESQPVRLELLAILTTKFWENERTELTVRFQDEASSLLTKRIMYHMNAWNRHGGIGFVDSRQQNCDVRISFEPTGTWSFVGTDIKLVPHYLPTTNFDGLTLSTCDAKIRQIVEHQTGHLLGLQHFALPPTKKKVVNDEKLARHLRCCIGWGPDIVEREVYSVHCAESTNSRDGLMDWQFPSNVSANNRPVHGAMAITKKDIASLKAAYPHIDNSN